MGQHSLQGLYNQLLTIENLGRCINERTLLLSRAFAFADSFKLTVTHSMHRVIEGAGDYKAITDRKIFPVIKNPESIKAEFEGFVRKTLARSPEAIQLFEDGQFDPAILDDISQLSIDDP